MSVESNPVREMQRLLEEQMQAQSEISDRVRKACGSVARKLKAENLSLCESETMAADGPFELNLRLESEGRAIAECRVFTGLNGVAYFDDGREPQPIDQPTQESFEKALADFTARALKAA
ncbi:MAG: hypothetical protein AB7J28_02280 [Hyphomonadaceae bacterium]